MIQNFCDCGSQQPYRACCQPYHLGRSKPDTPEQLMRSRYSAFCQAKIDYLVETLHPTKRQQDDHKTLANTINNTQWLGLKVLQAGPVVNTSNDQHEYEAFGLVEFVAFYQDNGVEQLHERSLFTQEEGQWYYLSGDILAPIKIGRNEPCWCGSRKKYKKCHGT